MKEDIYFETIKCHDYKVFNLSYHKKRILNTIGLNVNLQKYIYPPSTDLLKCKLLYTKNEILDVQFTKYIQKNIKSFMLVYNDEISYGRKQINRQEIDALLLQKKDCDEIMIIKNNLLTDTSIANIAIFYNNHWISPKIPLLKGTALSRLMDKNLLIKENITVKMLLNSSKIALLNAMIGFHTINNTIIKTSLKK
jgi:4-amino-4-deoxychorismate lyase